MDLAIERSNYTRRSPSIPRKLLAQGSLHLLPVYFLLNLSDLGREGIRNSGSYRFADHVYVGHASGRTALGRLIDRGLLSLPATRAFRRRYQRARTELRRALDSFDPSVRPLRVLGVPCGIPRDVHDLAATLRAEDPALLRRIEYHGLDIDPCVLQAAAGLLRDSGIPALRFHRGDALRASSYPPLRFHAVVSTGLGEFLTDDELRRFYRYVHAVLEDGGTFYTSATGLDRRSEMLLRIAELKTNYRTLEEVSAILHELPWKRLSLARDATGLQTFVTAVK
jgi:hypothetical protein